MNEKLKIAISFLVIVTFMVLLAFPLLPAFASESDLPASAEGLNGNNGGRQVTSLEISKDVDSVSAPGVDISLSKTASESQIQMMVGDVHSVSFTINVDATVSNSYSISGNIFVDNTGDWPANVIAVSDTVWYKAGGPAWLPASSSITTTVPIGAASISTGSHTYSYAGTFTLPVPLASVTSMSNLIEITIDNHPNDGVHVFHFRQDFSKPNSGGSTVVQLEDIETIAPAVGLSYEIKSVTINGVPASLTGPWTLDLADAPFTVVIEKDLTAEAAGDYILNNKARIGDHEDQVDVGIKVEEPVDELGAIEGYKWLDANGSGEIDEGDTAMAGVTIQLWKDGQMIKSTTTDENGYYHFVNLDPGNYTVVEVAPDGTIAVSPQSVEVYVEGEGKWRVDFLNRIEKRLAEVQGYKWYDANGDGIHQDTEPALSGVKIVLDGNGIHKEAVTGADGFYSFQDLEPGYYTVREEVPEGYFATSPVEVSFELAAGEVKRIDFTNAAAATAGEIVTPLPELPAISPTVESPQTAEGQTLPVTGFDLTYLLIIIASVILLGVFIASFGAVRMTR